MKITALEIRQKQFEKELRGFNKDEVKAFTLSLSQEWERVVQENKELRIRLEQTEKEVLKLREVEDSLFKTLKTAESTGASMVDQASKSAELTLKEAKIKAEKLFNDTQNKSDDIINSMQHDLRELENQYRELESHKDNLIREVKAIANVTLEKLDKAEDGKMDFTKLKDKSQSVAREIREESNKNRTKLEDAVEIPAVEAHNKKKAETIVENPVVEKPKEEEPKVEIKEEPKDADQPRIQFEQPIQEENSLEEEVTETDEVPKNTPKTSESDTPQQKGYSTPSNKSFFDEITE